MSLTAAQLRLLPFLATHLTFPEIASRLFISRNTVKSEAVAVYRKLGVALRSDAMERAVEVGLLRAPSIRPRQVSHAWVRSARSHSSWTMNPEGHH
jgi:DNA-binding CsgD family transcriptional regulator